MIAALRVRDFRRYFCGQGLSFVGDGLRNFVLPLIIFQTTHSTVATSVTFLAQYAPLGIVGLFSGTIADRFDRRRAMLACDGLRAAAAISIALLLLTRHPVVSAIYPLLLLMSVAAAIFLSSQTASIPVLLPEAAAADGIGALMAAERTANVVAPLLGATLMGMWGPAGALFCDALSYFCSQASIASVRTLGGGGAAQTRPALSLRILWLDVCVGARAVFGDPAMTASAASLIVLNTIGMASVVLLIPFLATARAATTWQISAFFTLAAVGGTIGAASIGRFSRLAFGPTFVSVQVLESMALPLLVLTHNVYLCGIIWALGAYNTQLKSGLFFAWRLRITQLNENGRAFAVVRTLLTGGIVAGCALGGIAASVYGVAKTMDFLAITYFTLAAAMCAVPQVVRDRR